MPYINPKTRGYLDAGQTRPTSPGELNYAITKLVDRYLTNRLTYDPINEVIGCLECVKLELYRRVVAPHEDGKIKANGDVYECIQGRTS